MPLIRVPASSANLGPGFDCLGLALDLYNYVEIEETTGPLKILLSGAYTKGIPDDRTNLIYRAALRLWQRVGFTPSGITLKLTTNIPPSRGLGSSSAAIVAGLYSANLLAGSPLSKQELLVLATEMEGHPDNVAAALYGGVTLTIQQTSGECIARSLGCMEGLKIVAVVPHMHLSTKLARSLLPERVSMEDAVWNLSRTGLLVAGLLNKDYSLLKVAMEDRLHEKYREKAIPGMSSVLSAAKAAGALGAVLSGAGPSLIAFVPENVDETSVGLAMLDAFSHYGVNCKLHYLKPDCQGAVPVENSVQFSQQPGGQHVNRLSLAY